MINSPNQIIIIGDIKDYIYIRINKRLRRKKIDFKSITFSTRLFQWLLKIIQNNIPILLLSVCMHNKNIANKSISVYNILYSTLGYICYTKNIQFTTSTLHIGQEHVASKDTYITQPIVNQIITKHLTICQE